MIMARIRWCTCRVENILTLGKLLSLWFCFLLHSILFLISQTSYRTYQIISSYELARPVMGTIFLVYIYIYVYVCRYVSYVKLTAYAELRGPNTRMLKVFFFGGSTSDTRIIHFLYARALVWPKKKLKLAP